MLKIKEKLQPAGQAEFLTAVRASYKMVKDKLVEDYVTAFWGAHPTAEFYAEVA